MQCPLCAASQAACRLPDHNGAWWQCPDCRLIFLPEVFHPTPSEERARYLLHHNSVEDEGYRRHLEKTLEPLVRALEDDPPPGAKPLQGLDFGSGPTSAAAALLSSCGLHCSSYDLHFANHPCRLERDYDFVVAIEVVEHFRRPDAGWHLLDRLLRPGAWLAVSTLLYTGDIDFQRWWYRQDPTHLCFYREETMEWIAGRFRWSLRKVGENVHLFHKGR